MQVLPKANRKNETNRVSEKVIDLEINFLKSIRIFVLAYFLIFLIFSISQMTYNVLRSRKEESNLIACVKKNFSLILNETPMEEKAKWLSMYQEEPEMILYTSEDTRDELKRNSKAEEKDQYLRLPVSILF